MTRFRFDTVATYAIALLAFALSYSKLVDLASRAGYGEIMSHAWPLIVDGIAVVAARGVLRLAAGRWYAWSLLVAGTAVSILAAVLNAMVPAGPLPPVATSAVTVIPALCLPFALHLARKMSDTETCDVAPAEDATAADVAPAATADPDGVTVVGGRVSDVDGGIGVAVDVCAHDVTTADALRPIATDLAKAVKASPVGATVATMWVESYQVDGSEAVNDVKLKDPNFKLHLWNGQPSIDAENANWEVLAG